MRELFRQIAVARDECGEKYAGDTWERRALTTYFVGVFLVGAICVSLFVEALLSGSPEEDAE